MSRDAIAAIKAALDELPSTCRYHGDRIDPDSYALHREACCDTGRPAIRRRKAEEALMDMEPDEQRMAAALQDPANRELLSAALRREARVNPEWINAVLRKEARVNPGWASQVLGAAAAVHGRRLGT